MWASEHTPRCTVQTHAGPSHQLPHLLSCPSDCACCKLLLPPPRRLLPERAEENLAMPPLLLPESCPARLLRGSAAALLQGAARAVW